MTTAEPVKFTVAGIARVSALLTAPAGATACVVLAHGAGASMTHPFMENIAQGLATRHIATLRYNFPYMEAGQKRPDRPAVATACVRAAAIEAIRLNPALPMFAGGKSFGGRMTSTAQAQTPLPFVRGLVFLGFPLHPAGKPSQDRATHLADIHIPMLFLNGTRDALAQPGQLTPVIDRLGPRATLAAIDQADHSFHVPANAGRNDPEVLTQLLDTTAGWITRITQA